MGLKIRIRELRQARGLGLAHVAGLVGISVPHLSQVERGIKNVNNHLLQKIAAALGVEPDDLISGTNRDDIADLLAALRQLPEGDRARVEAFARALLASQRDSERNQ